MYMQYTPPPHPARMNNSSRKNTNMNFFTCVTTHDRQMIAYARDDDEVSRLAYQVRHSWTRWWTTGWDLRVFETMVDSTIANFTKMIRFVSF
ncbi:unnamed protein product, partial [Iphiclides podalirius]